MTDNGETMSNNGKCSDLSSCCNWPYRLLRWRSPDAAPANVPAYDGVVPAGCFFWQQAATRTFTTSSKDHAICSIGMHTHHLAEPASNYAAELGEALMAMNSLNYVRPSEIAGLPVIKDAVEHVVYGPLASFPLRSGSGILFRSRTAGTYHERGGHSRRSRACRPRWAGPRAR